MMSSAGETSKARNLVSGCQRKKKQFRRGAAISIINRTVAQTTKQTAAAHGRKTNINGRAAQSAVYHLRAVLLEELPTDRLAGAFGQRQEIIECFCVGAPRMF
jgi:hypothetical protein